VRPAARRESITADNSFVISRKILERVAIIKKFQSMRARKFICHAVKGFSVSNTEE